MSIVLVVKDGPALTFSTDSRMMHGDYSGVATDDQQKVFEVAEDTFIATTGRKVASEYQIARAREVAAGWHTSDIRIISAALERDTIPTLKALVDRLRLESDDTTRRTVSGETMLHGCTLVGRSAGQLGYVSLSFWVQKDGSIKCTTEAYFDAPRKVSCISGTPAELLAKIASAFVMDMATWTDPIEQVSMRFLETVKGATPTIGGPWQVLRLDGDGAHWVSRPPVTIAAHETAAGTCNATVSFTSPIITVTGSGYIINIDSANGFKVSKGSECLQINGASEMFSMSAPSGYGDGSYNFVQMSSVAMQMNVSGPVHREYAYLGRGLLALFDSANVQMFLGPSGFTKVNNVTPFTGTLAAAIAAGKSVVGGVIV